MTLSYRYWLVVNGLRMEPFMTASMAAKVGRARYSDKHWVIVPMSSIQKEMEVKGI